MTYNNQINPGQGGSGNLPGAIIPYDFYPRIAKKAPNGIYTNNKGERVVDGTNINYDLLFNKPIFNAIVGEDEHSNPAVDIDGITLTGLFKIPTGVKFLGEDQPIDSGHHGDILLNVYRADDQLTVSQWFMDYSGAPGAELTLYKRKSYDDGANREEWVAVNVESGEGNWIVASDTPNIVYVNDGMGQLAYILYSTSKNAYSIVQRDSAGRIKASDGVDPDDVVTVAQMNMAVSALAFPIYATNKPLSGSVGSSANVARDSLSIIFNANSKNPATDAIPKGTIVVNYSLGILGVIENNISFGGTSEPIPVKTYYVDISGQGGATTQVGGPLNANDFGTTTPTQQNLTKYAFEDIWGSGGVFTWNAGDPRLSTYVIGGQTRTAEEILPATWVRNLKDNHSRQLANNETSFRWSDIGVFTIGVATNLEAGIVKGNPDPNVGISIDVNGKMSTNYKVANMNWVTLSGGTIQLASVEGGGLNNLLSYPSGSFTLTANTSHTLEGYTYLLKITIGGTAPTMTLGTGVTNPRMLSLGLNANSIVDVVLVANAGGGLEIVSISQNSI